jgi:hypothetical protein
MAAGEPQLEGPMVLGKPAGGQELEEAGMFQADTHAGATSEPKGMTSYDVGRTRYSGGWPKKAEKCS